MWIMESQQQARQDANQGKDWPWKIGGESTYQTCKVYSGIFYRVIVNLYIKYFSADNQIYIVYTVVDLVVLELKMKIPLSHSICPSILQQQNFIQ